MEFDLGPGKCFEVIFPRIVLEFCKILYENYNMSVNFYRKMMIL